MIIWAGIEIKTGTVLAVWLDMIIWTIQGLFIPDSNLTHITHSLAGAMARTKWICPCLSPYSVLTILGLPAHSPQAAQGVSIPVPLAHSHRDTMPNPMMPTLLAALASRIVMMPVPTTLFTQTHG